VDISFCNKRKKKVKMKKKITVVDCINKESPSMKGFQLRKKKERKRSKPNRKMNA
jgi:hypothetical protein